MKIAFSLPVISSSITNQMVHAMRSILLVLINSSLFTTSSLLCRPYVEPIYIEDSTLVLYASKAVKRIMHVVKKAPLTKYASERRIERKLTATLACQGL